MSTVMRFLKQTLAAAIIGAIPCTSALACDCASFTVPDPPPATGGIMGLEFTKTAQYRKEFHSAVSSARKFCEKYRKEHPRDTNLAIVSDIDETLLDNREEVRIHPELRSFELFDEWIRKAKAPALKETAEFVKWARKNGFAVFLITGRPESDRQATIINMVREKISYDGLYCRPSHDGPPAEEFKSGVRSELEKLGFKIVCNIGDQYSDLAMGYSLDCEKLPNKMYFIK